MAIRWMMMILHLVLVLENAASHFPSVDRVFNCRPEERDALLSFKTAFPISNASHWYSNLCDSYFARTERWDKNRNCCEWDGVTCNPHNGHVVELDLDCSCLSGSFSSNTSLVLLPRLHRLSLAKNYLSGQVPREIGWLSHLRTLDLSFNFDLKMSNFPAIIPNLTYLRYLDLTGVSIDSYLPPVLFNFSNLAYLKLSSCGFNGEFPTPNSNTSMLARVVDIDLSFNKLTGTIPGWLFTRPSLDSLSLRDNSFTRISEFKIGNVSSLTSFMADYNQLQGKIPDDIFELHNLRELFLQGNNLRWTIPLSKLYKLQSLKTLHLFDISLSIIDDDMDVIDNKPSWPSFDVFSISSCNLGRFPNFLREHVNLTILELSNNGIHGIVPTWFLTFGSLQVLDLSHNSLQGGAYHLPWQSMLDINIQYNLFHGYLPTLFSATMTSMVASNNHFTGEIPLALCDSSALLYLELGQNNLTGNIPDCFASLVSSRLLVLDLRQNRLQGAIPSLFQGCKILLTLSLSGNKLEGQIPKSISGCSDLELLDLSSNNLNDTFPHWLGILPSLEVLTLASNNLHGSLVVSNITSSFQVLKILDISNNDFTGDLPVDLLMSMKEMTKINTLSLSYMVSGYAYHDSIMASIKGVTRPLDVINDAWVLVDVSRNRLEGLIPNVIGDLVSLRGLNLANNNFSGHIPPSLSNLNLLEALDLSFNNLEGRIPPELVNLKLLAFFNVSENDLVGPVPTGKQFDTFLDPSYLGNPGLCGPLLRNKCGKPMDAPPNSASINESSGLQVWDIVLMGIGSGIIVGLAWGYLIFWQYTPLWVGRLILHIEALVVGFYSHNL